MKKKPLIGLIPLMDYEKESYWMLPGYMKGIAQAGGIPIMLPLTSETSDLIRLTELCDGLIFTGGQDVSPEVYWETASDKCGECCPERDAMEKRLLQLAIEQDKAVLGICRGIQSINALLGGTLYQDLPTEHPSAVSHRQKPPYDKPVHTVRLVEDCPLYRLLQKSVLEVNSCHHQAIKELAASLRPMAYSQDGLVEAAYLPTSRFVWAVQWHPEFSYLVSQDSRRLLEGFVEASQKHLRI